MSETKETRESILKDLAELRARDTKNIDDVIAIMGRLAKVNYFMDKKDSVHTESSTTKPKKEKKKRGPPKNPKTYECTVCGKTLKTDSQLMIQKHNESKAHKAAEAK